MTGDVPSLAAAARAIAAGTLSPVALTDMCLDRVARFEPRLNAFITLLADDARAAARAAESEIAQGRRRGPLHGIPLGLKDAIDLAGVATTAHSAQLRDNIATADAPVTRRLKDAGAIILGKLACHEFCFANPSYDLPWPIARNAWGVDLFPGGSSSGTAVAIASGMVLGGLGTDTSGSIRSPAVLSGIAGLKPTYDLVPRDGVIPLSYSLDHVGPMAWSVEDCAILFDAMTGAGSDWPSLDLPPGLRVGVVRRFFEEDDPASPAGRDAIAAALGVFRDLGCTVRDVTLPPLGEWNAAGFIILLAEGYAVHERWLKTRPHLYGAPMRETMMLGATISAADYLQATRRRAELNAAMDAVMEDVDILVTAVQPGEAPRFADLSKWRLFAQPSQRVPFNLSGYPALAFCCGFGPNGLPLGISTAARPYQERVLLALGHAYESATPWRTKRPAL